ncbi:MAG: HDOD domain-containing protein [Nitrospira sp.]|nr:HDOD domain-containing protein [bacterium]MBL7050059.1 HDOD domain-containing protein [Nitrospira sp.]
MDIPEKNELINKAGDLKVLPFVARKLLSTISEENVSINDISDIIEKDQTIAARVLKISNSALYGLRHEITSLNQALMVLGLKTVRSLVLSISTRSLYKNFGMKEQIIWDHSVGAGISAKLISAHLGSEVADVAFIGGLMHDLGKVVMNNETPDAYTEVIMRSYNDETDSMSAETEVYGYNHTEIGAGVTEKWGFSPMLINILKNHHLQNVTLESFDNPISAKSVACVNLADFVCKKLGIGYRNKDENLHLHKLPSAVYLGFQESKMDQLLADIEETYENEKSIFT